LSRFSGRQAKPCGKGRCTSAHAPSNDHSDNSSAHTDRMLDHDRRLSISRISDRVAWAKTMFPVIHQSIRDAQAQFRTGHQDIRTYLSDTTAAETTTTTISTTPTSPTTTTARTRSHLLAIRQRFQLARTHFATISTAGSFLCAAAPAKSIRIQRSSTHNPHPRRDCHTRCRSRSEFPTRKRRGRTSNNIILLLCTMIPNYLLFFRTGWYPVHLSPALTISCIPCMHTLPGLQMLFSKFLLLLGPLVGTLPQYLIELTGRVSQTEAVRRERRTKHSLGIVVLFRR
jgi:hypothetical protein